MSVEISAFRTQGGRKEYVQVAVPLVASPTAAQSVVAYQGLDQCLKCLIILWPLKKVSEEMGYLRNTKTMPRTLQQATRAAQRNDPSHTPMYSTLWDREVQRQSDEDLRGTFTLFVRASAVCNKHTNTQTLVVRSRNIGVSKSQSLNNEPVPSLLCPKQKQKTHRSKRVKKRETREGNLA